MSTPPPSSNSSHAAKPGQAGIDPRSPRFGAGITAVLLLIVIALSLVAPIGITTLERASEPGFVLFSIITVLFGWGAIAGIQRHPYGAIFRALVRPRLGLPTQLEDPVPPTFAQGVGFVITLAGFTLHLLGVPYGLVITGSAAFVAAFLNSVFGYCLGCQIYLLLVRTGIIGRSAATGT